ncbi:hypothetical protein MKZ42_03020 [Pseudoalteromonas shioyasakiensis]|uniref:DUF4468 domain-containing protein n=1 Tax=Pseudoalteromonas shioyasakiensis TaxID=1190813 RepID=A0ABT6U7A6_9GAMM|nr:MULTISPECIES: hypothetical protein [Pseudoalteromonas]MDI4670958.1 hypothetical protein [Pseudoalteromonas shioyasakiensis]MDI4672233.1 hypothetical protein [Pseudoalteromonas shioyasakiensis]MDI4687868.1 hypothetical protein [Pseudoalteromonas shioyasakiensis]MDI4706463.1 hypothetical protein [Pseudoalteromonas shioyasakiensis]NUJ23216.1 hypothetical protein [Pseudoalteromonas sp. 0802]
MKFVFLLVILVLSHTAHAADTVRVIKFKTIGLTVNEYNIADLIYKEAAQKQGAYFIVNNSQAGVSSYSEKARILRPISVSIVGYKIEDSEVIATIRYDHAALEVVMDNYKLYLKSKKDIGELENDKIIEFCHIFSSNSLEIENILSNSELNDSAAPSKDNELLKLSKESGSISQLLINECNL